MDSFWWIRTGKGQRIRCIEYLPFWGAKYATSITQVICNTTVPAKLRNVVLQKMLNDILNCIEVQTAAINRTLKWCNFHQNFFSLHFIYQFIITNSFIKF